MKRTMTFTIVAAIFALTLAAIPIHAAASSTIPPPPPPNITKRIDHSSPAIYEVVNLVLSVLLP